MTRVDFHSNVPDPLLHACKLVRKAWQGGHAVVCYSRDTAQLADLDRALWSFSPTDFIPHVAVNDPLAAQTPVLLCDGSAEPPIGHHAVLVNLDAETPAFFSRFERLIEIVGRNESAIAAARTRFRFYRDRGYVLQHHDFKHH